MAHYDNLPVYKAAYDLLLNVYNVTGKVPRDVKFTLIDLIKYLLNTIIFRDPVKNCHVIGSPSNWDGLPPAKSLLKSPPGVGLPIGDLTSQLFSNIYLNLLDQYVKRSLHCRYYGRYVDDFYIIHRSRRYLRTLIPILRDFLQKELHLTLHPNKIILNHYSKGMLFLGACIKPYRNYPSRRTVNYFRISMRALERECSYGELPTKRIVSMLSVINSYCDHLSHFKSFRILDEQFAKSPLKHYFNFSKNYKKAKIKSNYKTKIRNLVIQLYTEN